MDGVVLLAEMHPQRLYRQLEQLKDVVPMQWENPVGLMPGIFRQDRENVFERSLRTLARKVQLNFANMAPGEISTQLLDHRSVTKKILMRQQQFVLIGTL
jgi:hypothetical protein